MIEILLILFDKIDNDLYDINYIYIEDLIHKVSQIVQKCMIFKHYHLFDVYIDNIILWKDIENATR